MLRLKDWKDRRWKKDEAFGLVEPSKSASNSTMGSGVGEGVWQPPLVPGRLFSVFLIRASHFLAGPLFSVPKTLPAFKGTISWNLNAKGMNEASSVILTFTEFKQMSEEKKKFWLIGHTQEHKCQQVVRSEANLQDSNNLEGIFQPHSM